MYIFILTGRDFSKLHVVASHIAQPRNMELWVWLWFLQTDNSFHTVNLYFKSEKSKYRKYQVFLFKAGNQWKEFLRRPAHESPVSPAPWPSQPSQLRPVAAQHNHSGKKSSLNDWNVWDAPSDKRRINKPLEWGAGERPNLTFPAPPDPLVKQRVGGVNPGLHWSHSAAPRRCSGNGVTRPHPTLAADLTRQLYCERGWVRSGGKHERP